MYRTFVIGYYPKSYKMAREIEKKATALAYYNYRVLSFSITNSGKAIIHAETGGDKDE